MKKIHLFVLACMLLSGIVFSVVQIILADPSPVQTHPASEIECDANLCVDTVTGKTGIGSTSPAAKLQINAPASTEGLRIVSASNYSPLNIRNSANSADIFRIDQTGSLAAGTVPWARLTGFPDPCASGQFVTNISSGACSAVSGLPSGTPNQTLRHNGTTWVANSVLTNNGTDTVTINNGTGKLTVGTVDPVFDIQGLKHSTYMSGMTGVKEETTGIVQLENGQYIIDFNNLEQSSDLWIFYSITDFGQNWSKLTVLISAEGPGGAWYQKEPENNRLIIYSQTANSVSYRLSAPRFDWQKWLNVAEDGEVEGLAVNEIINDRYIKNSEKFVPDSSQTLEEGFSLQIKEFLSSIGLFVENGITRAKQLIAERITTDTAEIGQFQTVDKATGQIYCIWIEQGEWVKALGECKINSQ